MSMVTKVIRSPLGKSISELTTFNKQSYHPIGCVIYMYIMDYFHTKYVKKIVRQFFKYFTEKITTTVLIYNNRLIDVIVQHKLTYNVTQTFSSF